MREASKKKKINKRETNETSRTKRDKFYRYFQYARIHAKILYKNFNVNTLLLPWTVALRGRERERERKRKKERKRKRKKESMALFSVHSLSAKSIERNRFFRLVRRQTTTRNDDSIFSSAPRRSGVLVYWNKERKKKKNDNPRIPKDSGAREKSVIKVLVKFGENSRHSSRSHRGRFPDRWASTRALLLFTRALRSIVRSSVLENIEIPRKKNSESRSKSQKSQEEEKKRR